MKRKSGTILRNWLCKRTFSKPTLPSSKSAAALTKAYGASTLHIRRNQVLLYHNTIASDHTLSLVLALPAEVQHDEEKI